MVLVSIATTAGLTRSTRSRRLGSCEMAEGDTGTVPGSPAAVVGTGSGVAVSSSSVATRPQAPVSNAIAISAVIPGQNRLIGERRGHHRSVGAYPFKALREFIELLALVPEV